jgi:hypothetical protein
MLRHTHSLAGRLMTLLNRRLLSLLHGQFGQFADCQFYDSAPITSLVEPPSLYVPRDELATSSASIRCDIFSDATVMLTDLTEARRLIRTELHVKLMMADTSNFRIRLLCCDT